MKPEEVLNNAKTLVAKLEEYREALHGLHFYMGQLDYNTQDDGTLVDLGLCNRNLERLLDDLRKECHARHRTIGKVLGARGSERALQGKDPKMSGELGTASVQVKPIPRIPAKNTPELQALYDSLGFPREFSEQGLVSLHWKHLQDYLAEHPDKVQIATTSDINVIYRNKR